MPIRVISSLLLLVLGVGALRNSDLPRPTPLELAPRRQAAPPGGSLYFPSELLCQIDSHQVAESSGLVRSAIAPGLLWTHNDSGGAPQIVAFDRRGQLAGVVHLQNAANRDWEEISSFRRAGEPWLVIADCGNNFYENRPVRLYFLREPSPTAGEVACDFTFDFQFEGGPQNCEAMAVDERTQTILFVSKVFSGRCEVFALPLPDLSQVSRSDSKPAIAKRIASPSITLATSMCLSADGERLVIVNYKSGFEFVRKEGESWQTVFARRPHPITLTWKMPQREAVCFDDDDRSLLMTSEVPQGFVKSILGGDSSNQVPLWRVPAKPPPPP